MGRKVFDQVPRPNVFLWNLMIRGYAWNGPFDQALVLYRRMVDSGVSPNTFTFPFVLKACSSLSALEDGRKIHDDVVRAGLESDVFFATALIGMYCKSGCLDSAYQVFEKMSQRDVVAWNSMDAGCALHGLHDDVVCLILEMQQADLKPNSSTLVSVLPVFGEASAGQGKIIHSYFIRRCFNLADVVVKTALLHMYAKCECLNYSWRLFATIAAKNEVTWSAMIASCVQCGHMKDALELFDQVVIEGNKPTAVTLTSALRACAGLTDIGRGQQVHGYSVKISEEEISFLTRGEDPYDGGCKLQQLVIFCNSFVPLTHLCSRPSDCYRVLGGLTAADVFAVEWMQTGVIHFGVTVSYYGFVSDVLELSEKYQKRFGPLRYLVAGVLKFLCLPKYSFEVEYLPVSKAAPEAEVTVPANREPRDSSCFPDTVKKTTTSGMHRASSLSSIDSILTPSRISEDLDTTSSTLAGNEPSDYVRGIDPKMKRMSSGRNNTVHEPEVLHPQPHLSAHSNWPRTRSKSRTDKGWAGLISTNDSRGAWGNVAANEKEDISSTVSDPGPIWDAEPKWDAESKGDTEPNWIPDDAFKLPGLDDDIERGMVKDEVPKQEEKWVVKKGEFLGVLLCNHACKTVQNLNSQVVAPKAEHDDKALDLLLVHGNGRLKLLRFFLLMQFGKHLSLPYVEYVQVKSLRLTPGKNAHCGCGIDGELLPMNGHVVASLLPDQCRLIGRPVQDRV